MFDTIGYAILDKLSKTAFWEWFTKKFLSSATTRVFGYPKFRMEDYFRIVDLMRPGRVYAFACSDYSSVGSQTIRTISNAVFTHGGMVESGRDRTTKVLHMRSVGLQYDHMLSLLREVDYFAVVEIPTNASSDCTIVRDRMINAWVNRKNFTYDFEEKLGNDQNKVYCSEFVLNICGDLCRIKPKTQTILGREVFAPDNILDLGKVIFSNHEGVAKKYRNDPN